MSKEIKNKVDDALFNYYQEAEQDAIREALREDVGDLDAYDKQKKRILFLATAKAKKKHNENLLELASKFFEGIQLKSERPVALLKELIQSNATPSLYRNLDKLTKENIAEIIRDKNLIELLEQLDKK